jgi:hypothetical protein
MCVCRCPLGHGEWAGILAGGEAGFSGLDLVVG